VASVFPDHADFNRAFVLEHVNALDWNDLIGAIAKIHPDVVINCVGLIKQHPRANDPLLALETNALLPHRLATLCQATQARLIHISTDCVFSGEKGSYTEEDHSDAQDLYGRTKYLGETNVPHSVTLRTSMIGPELHTKYGLLEWFLNQKQAVKGFKKAIFSGFTTDELSRIIAEYVLPNPTLQGLYHVSSEPISKYDLLHLFNHFYARGLTIEAQNTYECDRSLISQRFKGATGYTAPAWPEMIAPMAQRDATYYFHKDIFHKDIAK
jgi:dTDP-4-dehydrorhamnose reductase